MRKQKGISFDDWPKADQDGFRSGYIAKRRSDPTWLLSQHSPTTRKGLISGYGCSLGWLADHGWLHPDKRAGERWPRAIIAQMVTDMLLDHEHATVTFRLRTTKRVISIIEPEADLRDFDQAIAKLPIVRPARNDIIYKVGIKDLVLFGLELMSEAQETLALRLPQRALLYQTGLQILWLILRPWRSTAFAGIQIGRELVPRGDHWRLFAPEAQTLHKKSAGSRLPNLCAQPLEIFLTVWRRELLPEADCSKALWSRPEGLHFDWSHLHYNFSEQTEKKFGAPISPKWFRKIVATTIGRDMPELIHIAKEVLGHSRHSMTAEFYDLAQSVLAFNALDACIDGDD